jgi:hypothetical protein
MNKSEILKLALDKATSPQEAMALARDMAAFLGDEPAPAPAPALPLLPAPIAANGRRAWYAENIAELIDLYTGGKTPAEIAQILGRTTKAIHIALDRIERGVPFGTRRAGE